MSLAGLASAFAALGLPTLLIRQTAALSQFNEWNLIKDMLRQILPVTTCCGWRKTIAMRSFMHRLCTCGSNSGTQCNTCGEPMTGAGCPRRARPLRAVLCSRAIFRRPPTTPSHEPELTDWSVKITRITNAIIRQTLNGKV